ncbi:MAG TPA: hypothetical protein DEP38_06755, partial [Cyanobacteria bacterium UBA9226]|nr:hypothetical protein [Cyanobacteria bacterium UBA9226]
PSISILEISNRLKDSSPSISSTTSGFILIMSNRDRIRKNADRKSNSPSNQDSLLQHLLGRPFSNGSLPRYGGLPQTRPFTPPRKLAKPLTREEIQAILPSLKQFGYNGAKIPVFPTHPTLSSPVQSTSGDSQVQDNSQPQSEILQPSEELTENEEISTEAQNIQQNDLGEGISDDEEKESDLEQLTEAELSDNPETQSQAKLDLQAKFSALAQFGYNGAKVPVFAPNPTPQPAIEPKSGVSQAENNYQEKPQGLQSDEAEKDNEEISTEGEKIYFSGGVSGDEDNKKVIQAQLVDGESDSQAKNQPWENIDIPRAIAYNKGLDYSKETISVIQDTLKVSKTQDFNEETVLAIAKWQYDKHLAEIDGMIGFGTRQSLGITQRLFDDKQGYGYNYFEGKPFIKGFEDINDISANDVKQGDLGNCYFAAGMMAVARANPSLIRDLIDDNRDGTYNVKLYTDEGVKIFQVTPYFPSAAPGIPAYAGVGDQTKDLKELWPMLLEKAYAQYKEGYGETGKGEGGYDLIGEGGSPGNAVKILTGTPASFYDIPNLKWQGLANLLINAFPPYHNWAVTAGTITTSDGEKSDGEKKKKSTADGIVLNHSYSVTKVYLQPDADDNNYTEDQLLLDLQNPWGHSHINGLSLTKFRQYFRILYINQVSKENVAPEKPINQIESDLIAVPSRKQSVAEMGVVDKIAAAISVAITKVPGEFYEKLKDLLNAKTLGAIALIMGAWGASHAVGVGQIADVILIGVGVITLGQDVISVIEDLIGFAAVLNAQTWEEIDKAGEHLAQAIATVGVELIIQFLTHRLAGSKAKKAEVDEAGVPRRRGYSTQDELTRISTPEGHNLIVTKNGKIFRCSDCEELGVQFAKLLEENQELKTRLDSLEAKYQQISEIKDPAQQKVLLEEADRELTLLERNIQELNVKRANGLLNQALDNFQPQPNSDITRGAVTEALDIILKSGEQEEKVALSKLVDELLSGGNSAAISDFLTRVTAIREVDGVVNGKFNQLYEAFHRGDAILAHGPLQPDIRPAKEHRLEGGQYSMVGSRDGKPAKEITTTWNGIVDYVIVYDGGNMRLILGRNHSGLSGGKAYVYGAGELIIDKSGKVIKINNFSGHYLPTKENGQRSFSLLVQKNFLTLDTEVELF